MKFPRKLAIFITDLEVVFHLSKSWNRKCEFHADNTSCIRLPFGNSFKWLSRPLGIDENVLPLSDPMSYYIYSLWWRTEATTIFGLSRFVAGSGQLIISISICAQLNAPAHWLPKERNGFVRSANGRINIVGSAHLQFCIYHFVWCFQKWSMPNVMKWIFSWLIVIEWRRGRFSSITLIVLFNR